MSHTREKIPASTARTEEIVIMVKLNVAVAMMEKIPTTAIAHNGGRMYFRNNFSHRR